jgi:glycosyltransferase involved in cell wall biosynthesis
MKIMTHHFSEVTLLITHYNRSNSLEQLLNAFKRLECSFGDIVVSDDGSKPEHFNKAKELEGIFNFRLISTDVNKGLGNNINKGQDAVKTSYVLYIQEDFVPKPEFCLHFKDALTIMEREDKWDLITFYAYSIYPYTRPYKAGYSEKVFKWAPWYTNNLKFYLYGDHPHLRRNSFLKKFGRYREDINSDLTEMEMSLSFIRKNGKALIFDEFSSLLDQMNSHLEPSTADHRKSWRQSKSPIILFFRWIFMKVKFLKLNFKLIFGGYLLRSERTF